MKMEVLDSLEQRIDMMLSAIRSLKAENQRLKEEAAMGSQSLEEEIERLKEELASEREAKIVVMSRIDSLVQKLKGEVES